MAATPDRVDDTVLDNLRARLRATRTVPLAGPPNWERGADAAYLAELVGYWADGYDWRTHEDRLRALPWVATGEDGGHGMRALRQPGDGPTVVLLHGWPDSFFRFDRVLPLLTDLDVVVPCLPGYPWALPTHPSGMAAADMGELIAANLADLGIERYVVSGGDIGSSVAEHLAAAHPDEVAALHLTDVPYTHLFSVDPEDLTEPERDYLDAGQQWQMTEGAYALEQATKPHTLAVALGDSPAGLLAWVTEKLRSWSDCGGDVESVFPRDALLTWVTLYWVSGAIGTSFAPYSERGEPAGQPAVPTGVTMFPHDLVPAPREFAERVFDVRDWRLEPEGGHFGAWERPEAYAAGLRRAVALAGD
ncbi:MAG: epoxide hydrolase [Lapillicoccus sp.]